MGAAKGKPGMVTAPTIPLGVRSSLTAIGPAPRTTMGSSPACERVAPEISAVAPGSSTSEVTRRWRPGATAYALKASRPLLRLSTASVSGAAPLTGKLALVPGGGTIHSFVGVPVVRASTAVARPAWGAEAEPGASTERLTTTPAPPVASTSAE
jgi:hypothetical protein